MLNKILKGLVILPALLFLVIGIRWLVAPAGVAPEFGLTLDSGLGLSTQVGDLSSFFLTLGICMLLAVATGIRTWLYPPILLLSIAALGRIVAWLAHDAALAPAIVLEVVVAGILVVASRKVATRP